MKPCPRDDYRAFLESKLHCGEMSGFDPVFVPDYLFDFQKSLEDEKHIHPLQLDVINRCLVLWSNPGEIVLTPFMGIGSEVYCALKQGRRAIGVELKESYYRQAKRNIASVEYPEEEQRSLFA